MRSRWLGSTIAGALILGGSVLASSGATQYLAWRLAYHPALGSPWLSKLYAPWSWIAWQRQHRGSAPDAFRTLYAGMGVLGALISAGLLALTSSSRKPKRHDGIHGTAHWATPSEIAAAG